MTELLLIVRLAGRRVALPARDVEAVVELEGLTPAPGAADHVAGLSALRSRVLTVIDGLAALGQGRTDPDCREAIVVQSEGHTYALLVEEVEDVVEACGSPIQMNAPIGRGWDRVGAGMIDAAGDLLLLVNPHLLIANPPQQVAV
jgi:purine-binding chemotaxis protein CheW